MLLCHLGNMLASHILYDFYDIYKPKVQLVVLSLYATYISTLNHHEGHAVPSME